MLGTPASPGSPIVVEESPTFNLSGEDILEQIDNSATQIKEEEKPENEEITDSQYDPLFSPMKFDESLLTDENLANIAKLPFQVFTIIKKNVSLKTGFVIDSSLISII